MLVVLPLVMHVHWSTLGKEVSGDTLVRLSAKITSKAELI